MRVVRFEAAKLLAQSRTRVLLGVCLLTPFVFAVAIRSQQSLPKDTLFGRQLRESGFATPLVTLGFAGTWAFPLLTSLVAGTILAGEDHHRTWSLLLTRTVSRGRIFGGKLGVAVVAALAVVVALAIASVVAGLLVIGHQPLLGLDGLPIAAGRSLGLVAAAWACAIPPVLGFTGLAILVSAVTRSTAAGVATPAVAGLGMLLLGLVNGPGWLHTLLLTSGFDAWHGLLRASPYYGPLFQSCLVSLGWVIVTVVAAGITFGRRDFDRG